VNLLLQFVDLSLQSDDFSLHLVHFLLREADFINCFNISARGVYCLIRSCRGLNKLIVSSCTGISDDNIDDVKENEQDEAKNHQTEVKDQQTEAKDSQLICKFAIHSHLKDLNLRWIII
jgi:hypothetical protein